MPLKAEQKAIAIKSFKWPKIPKQNLPTAVLWNPGKHFKLPKIIFHFSYIPVTSTSQ